MEPSEIPALLTALEHHGIDAWLLQIPPSNSRWIGLLEQRCVRALEVPYKETGRLRRGLVFTFCTGLKENKDSEGVWNLSPGLAQEYAQVACPEMPFSKIREFSSPGASIIYVDASVEDGALLETMDLLREGGSYMQGAEIRQADGGVRVTQIYRNTSSSLQEHEGIVYTAIGTLENRPVYTDIVHDGWDWKILRQTWAIY